MKSARFIETTSSPSICLFCWNRLQLQSRNTPSPFRAAQKRRITGAQILQKPPGEAVARHDDESSSGKLEPPQIPKKWGKFGVEGGSSSMNPFPDPDVPQRSPRWGAFAAKLSVAKSTETFPDPDIPQRPVSTSGASPRNEKRVRPSPRWDDSSSTTIPQAVGEASTRQDNVGRGSSRPLIRWHKIGSPSDAGQEAENTHESRWNGQARSDVNSVSLGEGARPSRQGWGTHLRPRNPQFDIPQTSHEGGLSIDSAMKNSTMKRDATSRPGMAEKQSNFVGSNRDQRGFISFRDEGPAKGSNLPTRVSFKQSPQDEAQSQWRLKSSTSVDENGRGFGIRRVALNETASMPDVNPELTLERQSERRFARLSGRPSEPSSALPSRRPSDQSIARPFESAAETVPEATLISLEERREARSRKDKKLKRSDKYDHDDERDFPDEATKRRPAASTPKRRQKRHEEEDDEGGYSFRDEIEDELLYDEETMYDEDAAQRKRKREQKKQRQQEKLAKQAAPSAPTLELPQFISVGQLATALHVRLDPFIEKLEELGFEEVANDHVLTWEDSSLIAMEYGYEAKSDTDDQDLKAGPAAEDQTVLPPRPPIVTIMGHVDHGKTTLLDYLRKSSVAASEHGGITQHIGAFSVPMASGKVVTFLDTPGHAAFLSMRQRGANVTDIVVLVVAADDSVKPQTIEAIKHARSAKVPIIVAINKIDKDEADVQRVKQDLLRHEIEVEDFGGDVQAIPVSGKTGQGLDELEEALVALAETLDMRAEVDGPAEGWILEATTKKAGRVATVLVRRGTLRQGDVIVAGTTWTRIRSLKNEAGAQVLEAPPGTPVEVDGWRDMPAAGDEVLQAPTEQKATSVVDYRIAQLAREQDAIDMEVINEARQAQAERREREKAEKAALVAEGFDATTSPVNKPPPSGTQVFSKSATDAKGNAELYVLIKADVSGSAEAIEASLLALPLHSHPLSLSVLRSGVGPISESDVDHIGAVPRGTGFLVSFNQAVPQSIAHEAEMAGVRIFDENVIYKVIDNVRSAVEEHLPPVVTKRVTGEAEAAQVFEINVGKRKFVKIAGCRVRNGVVAKGKKVKVYRGGMDDKNVVYDGTISSLKSQKKDVQEMRKGTECGMGFEGWEEFLAGDVVQCYEEKSEKRRLM